VVGRLPVQAEVDQSDHGEPVRRVPRVQHRRLVTDLELLLPGGPGVQDHLRTPARHAAVSDLVTHQPALRDRQAEGRGVADGLAVLAAQRRAALDLPLRVGDAGHAADPRQQAHRDAGPIAAGVLGQHRDAYLQPSPQEARARHKETQVWPGLRTSISAEETDELCEKLEGGKQMVPTRPPRTHHPSQES
jgi:hypothetical protein